MITINKTLRPSEFDEWKSRHAQDIKTWIADKNLSANDIWAKLPDIVKRNLQETLLVQQGSVCCYCGGRIEKNAVEIEHLLPKNTYRELVFDYDNLFACCFGGSKEVKHVVKNGETLENIATHHHCNTDSIKIYTFDIEHKKHRPTNVPNQVKEGDNLQISPIKEKKHCGNKKDNKEIAFDLKDKELPTYFDYKANGTVNSNKKSIQNDIDDVLFLNEENLIQQRKKQIMAYSEWFKSLAKMNLNKQQLVQRIDKQRKSYLQKNDGKFQPFYFVLLNQINKISMHYAQKIQNI